MGRYEVILYGSGTISMSGDGPWKNGTKTTHKTWVPSVLAAFFRAFMSAPARKMMDPRSASKSVSTDLEISSMEFHSGFDGPRGEMVRELTRADP